MRRSMKVLLSAYLASRKTVLLLSDFQYLIIVRTRAGLKIFQKVLLTVENDLMLLKFFDEKFSKTRRISVTQN